MAEGTPPAGPVPVVIGGATTATGNGHRRPEDERRPRLRRPPTTVPPTTVQWMHHHWAGTVVSGVEVRARLDADDTATANARKGQP